METWTKVFIVALFVAWGTGGNWGVLMGAWMIQSGPYTSWSSQKKLTRCTDSRWVSFHLKEIKKLIEICSIIFMSLRVYVLYRVSR